MWKCEGCGACCKFISISVSGIKDKDMIEHLEAHGITVTDKYIIIPARCKYLSKDNRCSNYENRYKICMRASKKECNKAKELYKCLLNQK